MNKEKFIEELVNKTNLTKEECIRINDILEDNFLIGKKNKEKTINSIMENLNFDEAKANEIYEISSSIVATALKEKLKHPFKDLD